ncbi:MAG: CHASE2 domain-containing protein [Roseateles sp.]|uniref:CHASE2 domain-containing protein n=1 Tax=Roseateles sp. TaxID=1971397 RepID=UPI0039EBFE3C
MKPRWPWLALPGALLLWAGLALVGGQPRVDRALGDLLLRATAPAPGAVPGPSLVVDIDDASLRALRGSLGEWPYPRETYALMLGYLRDAGARLVVMDIVFTGPRDGDAALAQALSGGLPVVLAAAGQQAQPRTAEAPEPAGAAEQRALQRLAMPDTPGLRWDALAPPADALLDALTVPASLGVISAALDDDGVLRRLPLLHRVQGRSLPSLALAARLRADGTAAWRVADGVLAAGPRRWPVDADGRLRLRLPPHAGRPAILPWQRLMRAALGEADDPALARELAGRAVFVGSSAFFADEAVTPLGRLPGAALNAAVFDALGATPPPLLRDRGPAAWAATALLFALGALPLLWPRRPLLAAGLALAGIAAGAAGAAWAGVLPAPAPALYLLALALGLTALERRRQARARGRELARQRELADARSRAKTELLAQVSHEMRTPMTAVLGLADILARSPLRPGQAHHVELLGHAGRQVFALVNDLLDGARIESGRLALDSQPFNLADLVELQLELLRGRAQRQGLWLRAFARPEAAGWLLGDPQRVAQIVAHLVGNAIEFTRRGGVLVDLSRDDEGRVLLSVQDTGIGIEPQQLARWAVAEEAEPRGLAITRGLARLMGGDLRIHSQPGEGSRFDVLLDLPDARPPQDDDLLDAPAGRVAPDRPLALLLAEDDDVNALVVEEMLAPLGHRITRVRDGAAALDALRAGGFDLVLMDLLMPGMDGLTATRQWRAAEAAGGHARLPIVALTARAADGDVQQALDAGCDAHLAKPASLAALLQALARHARRP